MNGTKTKVAQAELDKFTPQAKMELVVLTNLETFLRRVKDLVGDEAYAYVEGREYLGAKIEMLKKQELARIEAVAKIVAEKAKMETEKAKVPAPVPALTIVKDDDTI